LDFFEESFGRIQESDDAASFPSGDMIMFRGRFKTPKAGTELAKKWL
jgi:hypothetical protein